MHFIFELSSLYFDDILLIEEGAKRGFEKYFVSELNIKKCYLTSIYEYSVIENPSIEK